MLKYFITAIIVLTLCGCFGEVQEPAPTDTPAPVIAISNVTATLARLGQTVHPPTATPSPTPRPTNTVTPTPTPTPLHPLAIERMRQDDYPGSDIVIEELLEAGVNYDRYLASYQSEGNKIFALLTIPQGEQPETGWPVIIFNHGYIPPAQYRTTERYIAYVDGFARNGYVVFRSDYRGHGFSEGVARGGYGTPDYTIDVLNAVASVKRLPEVDPERIGMWGHSMGGYITLRSMVVTEDVKVGVIWAGVVVSYADLFTRWRRPGPTPTPDPDSPRRRWRQLIYARYGSPETNPDFWNSISANAYVADVSGPIQLHHGGGDSVVPVEFSEILYNELQAEGRAVEYYLYPGDNHNISANFSTALERSLTFFDAVLRPVAGETNLNWVAVEPVTTLNLGPRVFSGNNIINLREGPDTTYPIMGRMQPNQSLPIIGRNTDSTWWQVQTENGSAWVSAEVTTAKNITDVPISYR